MYLLKISKRKRSKIINDNDQFYESFFTDDDIVKYECDVRNVWRFNVMEKLLSDTFPGGEKVLVDVGCGLGFSCRYMPENYSYKGIEFSETTLSSAKNTHSNVKNTEFIQGGFPTLPLESEVADFVICTEVIEHIEDDDRAIEELFRILKPGGFLWITVPSTYYWSDYYRLIGHYRHYTGDKFTKSLVEHGLKINKRIPQYNDFWRIYHYAWIVMQVYERLHKKIINKNYLVLKTSWYGKYKRNILNKLEKKYCSGTADLSSTSIVAKKEYKN